MADGLQEKCFAEDLYSAGKITLFEEFVATATTCTITAKRGALKRTAKRVEERRKHQKEQKPNDSYTDDNQHSGKEQGERRGWGIDGQHGGIVPEKRTSCQNTEMFFRMVGQEMTLSALLLPCFGLFLSGPQTLIIPSLL